MPQLVCVQTERYERTSIDTKRLNNDHDAAVVMQLVEADFDKWRRSILGNSFRIPSQPQRWPLP